MQELLDVQQQIDATQLQVLQHFITMLRATRTDHEYLEMLVTKVLPLMHLIAQDSIDLWEARKNNHLREIEQAEEQAQAELKKTYAVLKKRIIEAKLTEIECIKQRLCFIDNILRRHLKESDFKIERDLQGLPYGTCSYCGAKEFLHRPFVFPSYAEGIFDHINSLCAEVFEAGRPDLVRDFVEMRTVKEYIRHDGEYVLREVEQIERPTFAPSIFRIKGLNEVFNWLPGSDIPILSWVAWDTLFCAEWDNRISRDFLRKKELGSQNMKESARSAHLLQLHSLRADMRMIKEKKQQANVILHNRERFEAALDVIINELRLELHQPDTAILPQALTLHLEGNLLQLKVTWAPDIIETLHLQSFQSGDSSSYSFAKSLVYENSVVVEIEDKRPKYNLSQALKRIGLDNILGQLFIAKTTSRKAILNGQTISLTGKSAPAMKKLRKYLQALQSCGWDTEIE